MADCPKDNELVPSYTPKTQAKKIITGTLNILFQSIIIILGTVETISMEDTDFEALRLGFSRSGKKAKTSSSKKAREEPEDINGYLGPWGSDLSDAQKIPCGPSEVITKNTLFLIIFFFRRIFLFIQEN